MRLRPLVVAMLLSTPACAITPQDFAYGMRLETHEIAPAYRLALPLPVYSGVVNSNLFDLRVFNAKNEVVPYEIRRPKATTEIGTPAHLPIFPLRGDPSEALSALRVSIQSGDASFDLKSPGNVSTPSAVHAYILDARRLNASISALELEWPEDAADFAGLLDIEASDDLSSWRAVASSVPIANLRADKERLIEKRAEFRATRAKYWRLSWVRGDAPFLLSAALAERARTFVEAKRSSLTIEGAPVASKRGEFTFDVGASAPVDRINIELPQANSVATISVFSRTDAKEIWRAVARQGFYRLDGSGGEMRNAALRTDIDSDRYWLLRFEKPEDVGEGIPRLHIEWIPHELVFLARGDGPYSLAYGSATAGRAETYLAHVIPKLQLATAYPSSPTDVGGAARRRAPAPPLSWKPAVLWTALALGVAVLGWMAFRLSRQLREKQP